MKNPFVQFILFAGTFLLMWLGLGSIPWMKTFKIIEFTQKKQEQLSKMILDLHRAEKQEVQIKKIVTTVSGIKDSICVANGINSNSIKIHVFVDSDINAFALPGGHIVINTSLISYCKNADMLAGVIAHEIAHIELDHVSKKITRELGMGILITTNGKYSAALIKEILKTLSSRGFDREMERDADKKAVEYMANAQADAHELAYYLKKLSETEGSIPEQLEWLSTHPDSKERYTYILSEIKDSVNTQPIVGIKQWEELKELTSNLSTY